MKKKYMICMWMIILFLLLPLQMIQAEPLKEERYIVGFNQEIDFSVIEQPYKLHHIHQSINAISVTISSETAKRWERKEAIEWIEQEQALSISADQVGWGHQAVVKQRTQNMELTGSGVKVAIIDTGINQNHPDLSIKKGISVLQNHASYEDDNGHGTHVAGIIGALKNDFGTLGIAPGVDLYIVKALDENGDGIETGFISGIEWAMEQQVDIINLSITTERASKATEKILQKANEQGIHVVAASGNNDTKENQQESDILYPARYPSVIGVGSINENLSSSIYSYKGPSLDYVAPGEEILSTYMANETTPNTYAKQSGTSMAAPFVSGTIALYKEAYPQLNASELKKVLTNNVLDLGTEGKDSIYGFGLIQAPESKYWDLRNHAWYRKSAFHLIDHELINGFTDQTFRPEQPVTRGEVAALVGRSMQLPKAAKQTFPDVPTEHYAASYINSLVEEGIISGYPDGNYYPNNYITRADVAVIVHRMLKLPDVTSKTFPDVPLKKYYASAINTLYNAKIITGYDDNLYEPTEKITRIEFIQILAKALEESLR